MKFSITVILFWITAILCLVVTIPMALWTWKWKAWLNVPESVVELMGDKR